MRTTTGLSDYGLYTCKINLVKFVFEKLRFLAASDHVLLVVVVLPFLDLSLNF